MEEQNRDYQLWAKNSSVILDAEKFFRQRFDTDYGYKFPHFAQRISDKIIYKIFSKITSSTNSFYSIPHLQYSPQWDLLITYLREKNIIESIHLDPPFNDEPKFYYFGITANLKNFPTDGTSLSTANFSRGISMSFDEALSKAIGEFLERYSLTLYREKDLLRASIGDMERSHVRFLDPRNLAGFSDQQKLAYPILNYTDKSLFYWVDGLSLLDGKEAEIPAQLVFWNYQRIHTDFAEACLREFNTHGAAGHFTRASALLAALYECVQRDSFLIHWLNKIPPRKIDLSSILDPEVQDLLNVAKRYRFSIELLDTTTDIKIPSCVCAIIDNSKEGPALAVGGGCGSDGAAVLRDAIREAFSVYYWLRKNSNIAQKLSEPYVPFINRSINQHARLKIWANPEMLKEADFLFKGQIEGFDTFAQYNGKYKTVEEELSWATKEVAKLGRAYEPFCYIANQPFLTELGYVSTKVIVPGLVPLYLQESNAPIAAKRISTGAEYFGYANCPLNPLPHPFP